MRKIGVVLGLFALTLGGLVAAASTASAYPDVTCHITDPGEACAGDPLTIHASVDPAVDCSTISITWRGVTKSGTGSSFSATFPTKKSDGGARETDSASCTYTDPGGTEHTVSTTGHIKIFKCHKHDGDDKDHHGHHKKHKHHGHLPNTGGERLLWLIIGLVLVTTGSAVVYSSRQKKTTTV